VRVEGTSEDLSVFVEQLRVRIRQSPQQLRRAFDVAEKERDGSAREVGHGPPIMRLNQPKY
jgi:hypothetical protein